ncbi:unnamed protein product [Protopolystoma xenopodis]|uniref:Uncharacterized protein n=1 Tax=Protopolystoma xenopodis TaxID=117903 RepID=A0A3S5B3R2_9PLAT|nr:unnamed protein product [Protopolystoma xenopodis]
MTEELSAKPPARLVVYPTSIQVAGANGMQLKLSNGTCCVRDSIPIFTPHVCLSIVREFTRSRVCMHVCVCVNTVSWARAVGEAVLNV